MQTFYDALGGKLNLHKSCVIHRHLKNQENGLRERSNISLVDEWQCKQIFGFSHQLQYATLEKDNKILQSIRGKQVAWRFKKLSFVAKFLVVNQVILASI